MLGLSTQPTGYESPLCPYEPSKTANVVCLDKRKLNQVSTTLKSHRNVIIGLKSILSINGGIH
jgi:hypothetical protein